MRQFVLLKYIRFDVEKRTQTRPSTTFDCHRTFDDLSVCFRYTKWNVDSILYLCSLAQFHFACLPFGIHHPLALYFSTNCIFNEKKQYNHTGIMLFRGRKYAVMDSTMVGNLFEMSLYFPSSCFIINSNVERYLLRNTKHYSTLAEHLKQIQISPFQRCVFEYSIFLILLRSCVCKHSNLFC